MSMFLSGSIDTGWKSGGGRMREKYSLLSKDATASISEDRSTTDGWRHVICVQGAYTIL